MKILYDYFRTTAQTFVIFVNEYKLFTNDVLQSLKDDSNEHLINTDKYGYIDTAEDYRKMLSILKDISDSRANGTIQNCGPAILSLSQTNPKYKNIINKREKTVRFLQNNSSNIKNLITLGHTDAHTLSIQEKNSYKLIFDFITQMKDFIAKFPIDKEYEKNAQQKALEELNTLETALQLIS